VGFPPPGPLCVEKDAVRQGLVCAFGSGDQCRACPRGAMCPGGYFALPLEGYWTADLSKTEAIVKCAEPAEVRCLGWSDAEGKVLCGEGFTGPVCGLCSQGWYPHPSDGCVKCPEGNAVELLLRPLLVYGGIVLSFLLLGFLFVRLIMWMTSASSGRIFRSAGQFALWALLLLQTLSQVGRASQPGLAPELAVFYSWLSVFELDPGVALHPACLAATPLLTETVIVYLLLTAVAVAVISLTVVHTRVARRVTVSWAQSAPITEGLCGTLARICVIFITATFALSWNTFFGTSVCIPGSASTGSEGLQVLLSNPFQECGQDLQPGTSKASWALVMLLCVFVTAFAAYATCRLRWIRNGASDSGDVAYGCAEQRRCCCRCCSAPSADALMKPAKRSSLVFVDNVMQKQPPKPVATKPSPPDSKEAFTTGPSLSKLRTTSGVSLLRHTSPSVEWTGWKMLQAATSLSPLVMAEYRPREAPLVRVLDLALIAIIATTGRLLSPSAVASSLGTAAEGGRDLATLTAVASASFLSAVIVSISCIAMVIVLLFAFPGGPYIREDAWKLPVRVGSLILATLASGLNLLNAYSQTMDDSAAIAAAVVYCSYAILVLSCFTVVSLFVGFWYAMLRLAWSGSEGSTKKRKPCIVSCVERCSPRKEPAVVPKPIARRASLGSSSQLLQLVSEASPTGLSGNVLLQALPKQSLAKYDHERRSSRAMGALKARR
jgi:hypothetical protein